MASLWQVSDNSTSELMARFYSGYVSAGSNKADAMRTAQMALLNGAYRAGGSEERELTRENAEIGANIKIDPDRLIPYKASSAAPFAHPFYWAPFVLIGNWK